MSEFPGKQFCEMTVIEQLRNSLQPQGTAPIISLQLRDRFFHLDFVQKCIDELEKMPLRAQLGEPPTNLEKLAYMLLCDSAYIEPGIQEK